VNDFIRRVKGAIHVIGLNLAGTKREWKDIEYFDDLWRERIRVMAGFIQAESSVIDLGCGRMWLRDMLPLGNYVPVDYRDRGPGTRICDFNLKEFPDESADYAFVSGCLEYIKDPVWFVSKIAEFSDKCVISYCTTDEISDIQTRRSNYWVNDLSRIDLIHMFKKEGMRLIDESIHQPSNNIFVFSN